MGPAEPKSVRWVTFTSATSHVMLRKQLEKGGNSNTMSKSHFLGDH
jgi:hypothetical protein